MLDPISDPKLKEIQKKLKEREKNYQRYAKPSRLILTSGIWVPPAIVVSYLWMLKISGFKGDVFHVVAPILIWFCIVTTSTFFLNKRASVFSSCSYTTCTPDETKIATRAR